MAQTKRTAKRPTGSKSKSTPNPILKQFTNLTMRSKVLVGALLFALVGGAIVAFSSAADPSTVTVDIIKTQYAYPSNALFVSPGGNDCATTSCGTQNAPYKTLKFAVSKAVSGNTIVMREGIYREALGSMTKSLTIQAYPNEKVWLDGSDVIPQNEWFQDGTSWRKDNWAAANVMCPKKTTPEDPSNPDNVVNYSCYTTDPQGSKWLVNAANPASFLPDMFFVDGIQLKQVLTRNEVKAGTFYINRNTSQVFIGDNPSGKQVEGSTRQQAMQYYKAGTAGSKLRGIGVRKFASKIVFTSQPGQIEVSNGAKGIEFDNMVFTQSAANGLFVTGSAADKSTGLVVRNSIFASNGTSGLSGNQVDSMTVENNIFYNNNTEKAEWEGDYGSFAGSKMAVMTNSTVKNNLFQGNYGSGFWCDLSCQNNVITGNMSRDNLVNGIYYEISFDGIIASNVTYGNGAAGLKASGKRIKIYNNTSYNNVANAIFAYDDPGLTRTDSGAIEIKNNIVAGGPRTTSNDSLIRLWMKRNGVAPVLTAMDSNLYLRSAATQPKYVIGWYGPDGDATNMNYTTLDAAARTRMGRESKGILLDGKSIGTLFKDAPNGNFQLVSGSAAVDSSEPLPADVATATGKTAGQVVSRGAISWRNGSGSDLAGATPDPVTPPAPPANIAPTATVSVSGNSFTTPAAFQVTANATDSDGSITKLEILQNGAVVHTCSNSGTCRYDANGYGAGTFQYSARAMDNATQPAIGTSGSQSVVVSAPATTPPPTPAPTPALTKPTGVQVGTDGLFPIGIGVKWNAVSGATGYKVTPVGRAAVARTVSNYVDAGVTVGNIYTYDVTATNGTTESPKTTVTTQVTCTFWIFGCSAKVLGVQ